MERRAPRFPLVQALRAVAALAVVVLHASQAAGAFVGRPGEAPYPWLHPLPWEAGVDLFFPISGFVVAWSSLPLFGRRGGVRAFLARRIARVVPLYWGVTTLTVLVALAAPAALDRPLGDGWRYVAASYLLFPALRPDGFVQPVFRLGWTLEYEALFYAAVACCLRLPRPAAPGALVALVAGLALAGAAWPSGPVAWVFWTDPIILEFVGGVLLAWAVQAGWRLGTGTRCLVAAGSLAVLAIDLLPSGVPRWVGYGLPGTGLLAAAVLGRSQHGQREPGQQEPGRPPAGMPRWERTAVALGDASYALYLTHLFVVRALREVWARLPWHGMAAILCYLLVTLAVSCLAALALHRRVERPAIRAARRLLRVPGEAT